jgi:Plasmid pRiA4b ORF-3-like protein
VIASSVDCKEATEIALRDLDFYHLPHPRILYEYDFGDSWLHWIEFDPQMPSEDCIKYPICVDGARHCPPEDVGGPHGYADFLKAWCDPTLRSIEPCKHGPAARAFAFRLPVRT